MKRGSRSPVESGPPGVCSANSSESSAFAWHPLLLGVYPVLALMAANLLEMRLASGLRALAVALLGAALLYGLLALALRGPQRAAVIASLCLLLFYSYGHAYHVAKGGFAQGKPAVFHALGELGRHRYLLPLWGLLLGVGVWWALRRMKNPAAWTRALNLVSLVALALPLAQMATFEARGLEAGERSAQLPPEARRLRLPEDRPPPDIYYIILDAYARDDVLRENFHLDNTPFLEKLEGLGFYVARCSQSNYAQTKLSLSSTLNMDYVETYFEGALPGSADTGGLEAPLKHSVVRQTLEALGYRTVAFETGYPWTEFEDADLYLAPDPEEEGGLNDFEALLVESSAALALSDAAQVLPPLLVPDLSNPEKLHRQRVLFALEQLESLPQVPGPKFVFAHIVSPHTPFVFGPQGEPVSDASNRVAAFRGQTMYINRRVERLVEALLAESQTPPIIILQGDHGGADTSPVKRTYILNAYHLPEEGREKLYEGITPVNTFRLIFDLYFGGEYELLPDVSYFSTYNHPYQFEVIEDNRPGCEGG